MTLQLATGLLYLLQAPRKILTRQGEKRPFLTEPELPALGTGIMYQAGFGVEQLLAMECATNLRNIASFTLTLKLRLIKVRCKMCTRFASCWNIIPVVALSYTRNPFLLLSVTLTMALFNAVTHSIIVVEGRVQPSDLVHNCSRSMLF